MSEKVFNKVLAANRGEIAVRIFRACYDLGIHTVAMYSKEDELSMFRTRADEAYLVGENKSPLGAYLDIPEIIDLAKRRGVDAIHPGYGFLSENADFARACEAAGITFIGPPSDVLGKMGDKLSAKQIAMECGVPVIPGCSEPLRDGQEALEKAISFGFPVILKAAAGGGGRGMRLCEMPEDVIPAFELVKSEARKAFGNDDIFIEKYLVQPKHIEVQILADQYGNVRHLGERDCSLQRRYQKVVEFAPAWSVPESIREQLHADAVKIAEAVGYVNRDCNILGWFSELAFAPVDLNESAMRDEWSGDIGVGCKYFSQDAVAKLAPAAGITLSQSLTPAEKLKEVQKLAEGGHPGALDIFRSIGVYLGHTLCLYERLYDIRNLIVLGRVASGVGGDLIVSECRRVLEEEYPEIAAKLRVMLPDENFRRAGQSMAAASLPEV